MTTTPPADGEPVGHCAEVLDRVYAFIDHELDEKDMTYEQVATHLEECAPCLEEYELDRVVKEVLARSCRSEITPEQVRSRVLERIRSVQVEISGTS